MGASITLAGERLIAQKQGAQQILTVSRFILANVPGLNPNGPVDRAAGKPAAGQIVGTYDVTQAGYVNPNQVVYSLMLGSDIGDFDWNWIGLETAENVLLMVAYVPTQQKRRNIPPLQLGNNVTRNFLVVFDGAQALTGLTIDASTWQHDFTVRLAGIDERERRSNRDIYGRACFFGSALQLEKVGAVYQLKPGTAYVEGVRLQRAAALAVVPPAFPTTAWLDVALKRELNDVVASWSVVWGAGKVDYVDSAGVQHYCVAIADLPSSSTITDRRPVEDIAGALIEHFASRAFVLAELEKLDSKQSVRVATTANIALTGLQTIDGVALSAGDRVLVKNQSTAAQNGIYMVASGAWARASDADLSLEVTPGMLVPVEQGATNGDSLWQLVTDAPITLGITGLTFEIAAGPVGLAAGTYRSVSVDKRGRVTGGTNPTTLAGYQISDAQPLHANLTALSSLVGAADRLPYFSGAGALSLTTISAFARTLLDDANSTAALATLGAAPLHSPKFTGTAETVGTMFIATAGGGLELGRVDGTAGPAYIDFHSGGGSTDYDARIISTGGNGSLAGATLSIQCGSLVLPGDTRLPTPPAETMDARVATTAFAHKVVGAGAVQLFARSTPPPGWLPANGAWVSRTTYRDLFAAIGTTFGAGDGSTTFNLPDLRGEFLRGWDAGRGIDPGRSIGSSQESALQAHTHNVPEGSSNVGVTGWFSGYASGDDYTSVVAAYSTSGSTGGNETRPRNIALLACIKY